MRFNIHISRMVLQGLLMLLCCGGAHAQWQRGLKGEYDVSRYPMVSFVWNTANPKLLSASQFALMEHDRWRDVSVEVLSPMPQETAKDILFLWEDVPGHKGQFAYFQDLLMRFFSQTTFSPADRFNIALFSRKQNNEPVLQTVAPDFMSVDEVEWGRYVEAVSPNKRYYSKYPDMTDLYLAINDGVNLLKQEKGRVGIIVVLTAGLNIKAAGATTELAAVMQKAKAADIPVYVMKYPLFGNTPEINTLSEETYGKVCATTDRETALRALQTYYHDMDSRGYGQDYLVTFRTQADRDGKSHPITLMVNGEKQPIPAFSAPDMTLGVWIRRHPAGFAMLAVLGAVIGLSVVFYVRGQRKKLEGRVAETERDAQERQKEIERRNAEEKAALNNRLDALQKAEQDRELQRQLRAREQELERLRMLMHNKHLYPRMQCRIGQGKAFDYVMKNPCVTLGRLDDNDLVLNDKSVSRYHAEIQFTGESFEIADDGSTNGVLVNGSVVQRAVLKNADVINLGKAKIVFYL